MDKPTDEDAKGGCGVRKTKAILKEITSHQIFTAINYPIPKLQKKFMKRPIREQFLKIYIYNT